MTEINGYVDGVSRSGGKTDVLLKPPKLDLAMWWKLLQLTPKGNLLPQTTNTVFGNLTYATMASRLASGLIDVGDRLSADNVLAAVARYHDRFNEKPLNKKVIDDIRNRARERAVDA